MNLIRHLGPVLAERVMGIMCTYIIEGLTFEMYRSGEIQEWAEVTRVIENVFATITTE